MNKVKTCVYAIALNEIKFVDRFMQHCAGADLVLVCDTGSTDGTAERLQELGATVHKITQRPWRFDIPRNTALSLIPNDIDICLSIDLDEFLQPGWAEAIDAAWQNAKGNIHRISYDYIWNWKSDGVTPDVRFYADKIHHRHGYRWRHPCHETLYWEGEGVEQRATLPNVILHHRADVNKSRSQYLHLLKMAVEEDEKNDRMRHYYARELMFAGKYEEAIKHFELHLSLPTATWREERAASLRYISRCQRHLKQFSEAQNSAVKATLEWCHTRDPWLDLARAAYDNKDWHTCYYAATKCLSISQRPMSYITDSTAWGHEPHDFAGIAAWNLNLKDESRKHCLAAYKLNPSDARLKNNCILVGMSESELE